jgi:hypothetical protein
MSISRRGFLRVASSTVGVASTGRLLANSFGSGSASTAVGAGKQIAIDRIESMPNLPTPFRMRDWKQVTIDLDGYLFDLKAKGPYLPLVWIDKSHANFDEDTFGLYITVGDPRCGPHVRNGAYHIAICDMPAVIGASLVGIDKSRQGGRDWVRMLQAFFNRTNGNNVFMTSSRQDLKDFPDDPGLFHDFWTDTLPSLFCAQLVHLYPGEDELRELMRVCADQFHKAVVVLRSTPQKFHHQSFLFAAMKPFDGPKGHGWVEPESAAAFAWMQYMAYVKFGEPKYLGAAIVCMDDLNSETENPLYDMILCFGAYLSARMNAELGRNYDTAKILGWCFSGGRIEGDGVISARCGEYDITGIWTMRGRGYLFESFQMAQNLVPLTRYDPRFARTIGKWMLNAANSARLFYPGEVPDGLQAIPDLKSLSRDLIAYEVLLRRGIGYLEPWEVRTLNENRNAPFFVTRDQWERSWNYPPFPPVSHFSIYSSTSVGVYGGIISRTEHDKILQLDCLKTDYFHDRAYPTHLYFNPYDEDKELRIATGGTRVDLYDAVSKTWVAKGVAGAGRIRLSKDSAAVIVQVPSGANVQRAGGRLLADDVVVDYHAT